MAEPLADIVIRKIGEAAELYHHPEYKRYPLRDFLVVNPEAVA